MRTFVAGLLLAGLRLCAAGQAIDGGSREKINDLIHTRLDLRFDCAYQWVYGKAEITLQPHFYPTDSLTLDAKQMSISTVELITGGVARPLAFTYDGWGLRVRLPRVYRRGERYVVRVAYVAKPAEAKVRDDQRGVYFINPTGVEPGKPTEIWTDSEADKASLWFPTIDSPDEKSTEEMVLTVPDRFVTLSNGRLVSQVKHKDGTRTDDWKMELPHSPYLFFFAVGDFAVVRDAYKGKEVSYYVEPAFTNTARGVFGETPAMIAFFQRVTGVPFPWVKY
jgi:aminopeptidase N